MTLARIDPAAFEGSKAQRREDILTYIAMIRLQGLKPPPIRSLPASVQADLKAIWRDYASALGDAERFLFSIGQPEQVKGACENLSWGKVVFDDLYIHRSLEEELPPLLRLIVFAGRQIVGDVGHNVIKMSIDGRKVSFLYYEDFDEDPQSITPVRRSRLFAESDLSNPGFSGLAESTDTASKRQSRVAVVSLLRHVPRSNVGGGSRRSLIAV